MSSIQNENYRFFEDLVSSIRGIHWSISGKRASQSDNSLINDAYACWCSIVIDSLSAYAPLTAEDRKSLYPKFILQSPDILHFTALMKELDALLLEDSEDSTLDGFKHRVSESGYRLLNDILGDMVSFWYQEFDPDVFRVIHTILVFLSRLTLSRDDLEEQALKDYLENERRLASMEYPESLNTFARQLFPIHSTWAWPMRLRPKHGPGTTADAGRCMYDKYMSLSADQRIRYIDSDPLILSEKGFERTARVLFVPKSIDKVRTISCEPATLMWYQQGVMTLVNQHFQHYRTPLNMPRRYSSEASYRNREWAWVGSLDGSLSTIDLSSASDSVAWDLVRKTFYGTPLYRWLLCTRSTHALLPSGEVIPMRKFAPMGSALCFPTEVMIFTMIIEQTLRECGVRSSQSDYCVYGDDIVIESAYQDILLENLTIYGFLPNKSKSFTNRKPARYGFFRESCGGEFMNGFDVTPIRISRRFSGLTCRRDTPSRILAIVDLANMASDRYPLLRRYLVKTLLGLPKPLRVPFSRDGEYYLYSPQPTNFHLESKWSESLQDEFLTHGSIRIHYGELPADSESVRLLEQLRSTDGRTSLTWPDDLVVSEIRTPRRRSWSETRSPRFVTL